MSKSLIRLIDAALVPAAIMICGKVLGIAVVNTIFNLEWGILSDPNDFFSIQIVYASQEDQIVATSYSNLIMFLSILTGFLVVLIRALYFSDSKISPQMIARLATNNLLNLITDSFEIYYKATVWLAVLWLSLLALLFNVFLGTAYPWTGALSFMCAIIATVILLRDVSGEIELARKNLKDKATPEKENR